MKVKELIALLLEADPDANIYIAAVDTGTLELHEVSGLTPMEDNVDDYVGDDVLLTTDNL